MAPDLFLAVIADAPFVDVLNTLLDAEPAADAGRLGRMGKSDREQARVRPHPLLLPVRERRAARPIRTCWPAAGSTDQRVAYWEPAKWVARLRERKTGDNLLLLNIDMERGP